MEISIKIKDNLKAQTILSLLKDLPYVELEIKKPKVINSKHNLNDLFGLWKDRDISAKELRRKAWQR